jgi:hypothetical protein
VTDYPAAIVGNEGNRERPCVPQGIDYELLRVATDREGCESFSGDLEDRVYVRFRLGADNDFRFYSTPRCRETSIFPLRLALVPVLAVAPLSFRGFLWVSPVLPEFKGNRHEDG